jgi:hypothetical protein
MILNEMGKINIKRNNLFIPIPAWKTGKMGFLPHPVGCAIIPS